MKTALCVLALLTGCADLDIHRADWCVSKGKLTITLPLDPLPYEHKCKAREVLKKLQEAL